MLELFGKVRADVIAPREKEGRPNSREWTDSMGWGSPGSHWEHWDRMFPILSAFGRRHFAYPRAKDPAGAIEWPSNSRRQKNRQRADKVVMAFWCASP